MAKTASAVDTSSLSHQELKDLANKLFAASQYTEAIQYYTYAISKQPTVSTYFSNRALCYLQLQDYPKSLSDCRQAIELDRNNLKAHFFAGQVHLSLGQYEEALTHLVHSHNLALEQRIGFGDEITSVIRLAKKQRFDALDEQRRRSEIELQTYLHSLILEDCHKQKQALLSHDSSAHCFTSSTCVVQTSVSGNNCDRVKIESPGQNGKDDTSSIVNQLNIQNVTINAVPHSDDDSGGVGGGGSCDVTTSNNNGGNQSGNISPTLQSNLNELDALAQKRINELNDLFAQVDERRRKREVPDYLCGRISFEIMRDPVVTPSGITYDRRSIIAHLHKVGHFDPLSRQKLTEDQLIPNLAMKEVVNAYLDENPWAETY